MAKYELEQIDVPLAEFRNNMSRYVELAATGVIVNITKHGKRAVAAIHPNDLQRMEELIKMLGERAEQADKLEQERQAAKAKLFRDESKEIGDLVKKALRETVEGDNTLLHDMARKYLGY